MSRGKKLILVCVIASQNVLGQSSVLMLTEYELKNLGTYFEFAFTK